MRFLKSIWIVLGIGIVSYLLFTLSIIFFHDVENYFYQTEFNSERWKTWKMTVDEACLRWDMMEDLQNNYELDGMTEREIVKLLGEPGSKFKTEWTYTLGMARRGIDTGTLSLTFENGKVKSHHIRTG